MAMVNAKPRKATPRTAPIISAECALSMGSRKMRCRSVATLARNEAASPAVKSARDAYQEKATLVVGCVAVRRGRGYRSVHNLKEYRSAQRNVE